jgi:hypothetical protein
VNNGPHNFDEPHPSWSPQEKWVWQKICSEGEADFNSAIEYGGELSPEQDENWPENRKLTKNFIETIILQEHNRAKIPKNAFQIIGAQIYESLDFSLDQLSASIIFHRSLFEEDVYFRYIKSSHPISFTGCRFKKNLVMDNVDINGRLFINEAHFEGDVDLSSAKINGSIDITNSKFKKYLFMSTCDINGHISMNGSQFSNRVELSSAKIVGQLDMNKTEFHDELNMEHIEVIKNVLMRGPSIFKKNVILRGAKIGGQLSLAESKFEMAINLNSIDISSHLFMTKGQFDGRVDLVSSRIGGQLSMIGAKFKDIFDLDDSQIGAYLLMNNAEFEHKVTIANSNIGRNWELQNSKFNGDLLIEGVEVKKNVLMINTEVLNETYIIFSKFNLLDISKSIFTSLDLTGSLISSEFRMGLDNVSTVKWKEKAKLILRNVEVGSIHDFENAWPDELVLNNFQYVGLEGFRGNESSSILNRDITWMKKWLDKQKLYSPQPYEQLAKVLRDAGHRSKANDILYAGRERERKGAKGLSWLWLTMQNIFIGYGFRIYYLLLWVLILTVTGSLLLTLSGEGISHQMPYGLRYSFDMLLPLIKIEDWHYSIKLTTWVTYYFYFHKVMGYFLVSMLIAGLTGVTKK